MILWTIAGGLMLLAFFTPDGRAIILRALKWIGITVALIFIVIKFMTWWLYAPSSPGYSPEDVQKVQQMNYIDQKRKACENIAPANWDEECRHLTMGND